MSVSKLIVIAKRASKLFALVCLCVVILLSALILVVDGNASASWFHYSLSESLHGPRIQLRGASWAWAFRHPRLMWALLQSQMQNPPVNGNAITPSFISGMCMADQQNAANGGAKIAACIALQPASGGVVDARGLTGAQTISSTVNLAFSGELLLGAATYTATACPAFLENTAGLYWHGLAPGHPQNTDPGQVTKIVSGVGGCTALVKQQVGAGVRDNRMTDMTLDGNGKQATAGLEIGTSQDNRAYYERIGFTGLVNGIITDSDSTHSVQDLLFTDLLCQFTTTCFNFGQATMNNIEMRSVRGTGDNQALVVGTDDAIAANAVTGFRCYGCDLETQNSSTTCINPVLIRNVSNFLWVGGWAEQGSGATCSASDTIQLGTASSTPLAPIIFGVHTQNNSNATTTHAIGIVSATAPYIAGVQGQGLSGTLVRNAATNSGCIVTGSYGGAAGILIDVFTGCVDVDGNTSEANNKKYNPLGLIVKSITGSATGTMDYDAFDNSTSQRFCRSNCLDIEVWDTNSIIVRMVNSSFGWNEISTGITGTAAYDMCKGDANTHQIDCNYNNTITTPLQKSIYNTASTSSNGNIGAVTMVTSPATNANCPSGITANCSVYEVKWYMDLSAVGTSCTGNTTVVFNILYTDPLGAGQQTVASSTITVATAGNGTLGTLVANGVQQVVAKANTTLQYSTTSFTAGTGCSPAPKYQITPTVTPIS